MRPVRLPFDALTTAYRRLWPMLTSRRPSLQSCDHARRIWRRFRPSGVLLDGRWYCLERCLEPALDDALHRARPRTLMVPAAHRVPLGLLLLSRQQLTVDQLRAALEAQRHAGSGRIGEWLLAFGFVTEDQVAAALARQWSCPIFRSPASGPGAARAPRIPLTLLERFVMIPVDYVESTRTLHIAFGEGLDYSVLYAIEQMTGCRTEPCMAAASFVRAELQSWPAQLSRSPAPISPSRLDPAPVRWEHEAVFACLDLGAEFARIIRSYSARLSASEIRIAACGSYLWVRLLRASRPPQDLLLCAA